MVDLRTTYLGLPLAHPIVASASPLSRDLDGMRRLEDAGASALVMASLFEEQVRREAAAVARLASAGAEAFHEASSFFPVVDLPAGPDRYLELVRRAQEAVSIPVIASLNGTATEGWVEYARLLEQAGARALELNVHVVAADLDATGAQVEAQHVDLVVAVRAAVAIPVAVKLGPNFSAFGNLARRLGDAGADALVLFNRFYRPDFDLDRREAIPSLTLSTPDEIRLPLMWIGLLFGRIGPQLAATTGVEGPLEVVKYLLAGADVVMTASALLRHGPGHMAKMIAGLEEWLDARGYASVSQARGAMSHQRVSDPGAYERAQYVRLLETYDAGRFGR